jgi:hypothetical protein
MAQPTQQFGSQQAPGQPQSTGQQQPISQPQPPQGYEQQFPTAQQMGGAPGQQQAIGQAGQAGPSPGLQQGFGDGNLKLEEAINDEMRVALHDFVQSATAAAWCADQCIDEGPHMAECIRLCRDVADLATLNIQLLSRDSVFGPEAAEVFALAAEACAQECAQHEQRHCQECAEELGRAARSTRKMLGSLGMAQRA